MRQIQSDPQRRELDRLEGALAEKEAELLRAREALRDSEERIRMVADQVPGMFYRRETDAQGKTRFTYISPFVEKITGYSIEEVEADPQRLLGRYHPDDVAELERLIETVGEENEKQDYWSKEVRYRHKDGNYVWVHMTFTRHDHADGSYEDSGFWTDVTERKLAEQTLRESEHRYRSMAEQAPDAFFVMDMAGRFLDVNRKACENLGYTREELLQMSVPEIQMRYDADTLRDRRARMVPGKPLVSESLHRRKDGTTFPVEVRSSLVELGEHRIIHSLARDVTERKQAEEALRQSEERLRTVIDGSIQGMIVLREGRAVFANWAAAKMFGYSDPTDLIGRPSMERIVPEDRERILDYVKARLRGEAVPESYEYRGLRQDGSVVSILANVSVISWSGDRATLVALVDITERHRIRQRLERSEERYRNLVEGSLQGIMVHRDHKPLFVNQAYAEMHGYDSPEEIIALGDTLALRAPHERARIIEYRKARMRGEYAPASYEVEDLRKDGSTMWVDSLHTVIEWDGQPAIQATFFDITERKLAEQSLRESEVRYRALAESPSYGIYVHQGGRIVYGNSACAAIFGYDGPQELTALGSYLKLMPPATWEKHLEIRDARLRGEVLPSQFEWECIKKDGSSFWVETNASVIDWNGAPAVQVTLIDITERVRAERALRASEERFHLMSENIPGAVFEFVQGQDGEYRFSYINRIGIEFMGLSPEEAERLKERADPFFDRMHPDEVGSFRRSLEESRRSMKPFDWAGRAKTVDGQWRWLHGFAHPRDIGNGEVVWNGVMLDTTRRKQAEEALHESEARFRELVESPLQGINVVEDGKIVFANQAEARILGVADPAELVGREFTDFVPSEVVPILKKRWDTLLRGERVPPIEHPAIQSGGREIWLAGYATPTTWQGRPAVQGVHFDITDRKQAEQALRESEEKYRGLIEGSIQGIGVHRDGKALFANDELAHIFGYKSSEDLLAMDSILSLYPEEEHQAHRSRWKSRYAGRPVPKSMELQGLKRDGSDFWVGCVSTVIDWEGKPAIQSTYIDITERKRSEEVLRLGTQIVESLAEGLMLFSDADHRIVLTNPRFDQMFGYDRGELLGKHVTVLNATGEKTTEEFGKEVFAHLARDGELRGEVQNIRKDGSTFWSRINVTRGHHPAHGAVWISIREDITARREAERALRESEEKYRNLIEGSVQGIIIQRNGKALFVNRAFADIFGYETPQEILELENLENLIFDRDLSRMRSYAEARLQGRDEDTPRHYETQGVRKDGTLIWVDNIVRSVNWDGEYAIQTTLKDITERRIAQRQHEFHTQMVEELAEGIVLWRCDNHVIVYTNLRHDEMFGFERGELIGNHVSILNAPTDLTPREFDADLSKRLDRERSWSGEIYNRRKDGTPFWSLVNIVRSEHYEYGPVWLEVREDITLRKQQEDDLKIAKDAAESANRAKTEFLSHMSHELRNPLNAIIGFTQLLVQDPEMGEQHVRDLNIINNSGIHLLELINDILDFNKIEAGRMEIDPQDFDLYAALESVVEMFRLKCELKGIELILDMNLDVPKYVHGDQRKVRQVLINLLGNAVKFTQQGRVSLSANSAQAGVRFRVADTGPGIPPEQIGLIMEPYRQLSSATLDEGTGLGLTITRHHVELMGGNLDVVSSLGEGSEFTVTLPLRAVSGAAALAEAAQQTIVGIAGGRKYSILVVDDDRNNRAFVDRRLRAIGFDTAVAENGLEAVQQFEAVHPDLILMDIGMPIMDGIEATRIIRSKEGGGAPKIVAVTAAAFVQNQEEILAAGCDGVVIKPFDERELLNAIAQAIGVEYVYGSPAPPSAPKALDWAGIQASLSPDIVVSLNNCLEMGNLDALRELAAGLAQSTEEAPARFGEYLLDCLHRSADGEIGSALNRIRSVEPAECTPVRTILLIDDEKPIRMLTRRFLEGEGFNILDAGDGASGVELCTAHAPDLHCVLLDMIMPGMNGEEALNKLREIRGDLPVIIISGRSEEAADSLVSRHEGVSFLRKPFTLESLMDKVRGIS